MNIQNSYDEAKPTLYIVSTPIGNLKDITLRAIETLKSVEIVLCEDTRVTSKLMQAYNIEVPLRSYQKFNERSMVEQVIYYLENHKSVALVSDAGTPLISDPGFILVDELVKAKFNVVSIPGASAALAALVTSGIVTQPFTFIGFLPRKTGEMHKVLESYRERKETLIIYESPNRIDKSLAYILEVLGNRRISIARELTKKFETYYRGDIKDIVETNLDKRGEYVLIIEGSTEIKIEFNDPIKLVEHYINQGYEEKEAIKQASNDLKVHKSEVYKAYKIK